MVNINFYLRSYTEKNSQRIWAVFYVEGKIYKIDTNQQISPSDWSKDKKKALTSFSESVKLNKLLKEQSAFLENYLGRCMDKIIIPFNFHPLKNP